MLKKWPKAEVIASEKDLLRIPFQTISCKDGDQLFLLEQELKVLEVSGHTKNHIAYFLPSNKGKDIPPILFSGDTLFAGGCGRLFEGSAKDMYKSLRILSSLPSNTLVYCAHEYTEQNLKWAHSLLPNDPIIKNRLNHVMDIRGKGQITLPTNIAEEKSSNLFIRAKNEDELAALRQSKDNWN